MNLKPKIFERLVSLLKELIILNIHIFLPVLKKEIHVYILTQQIISINEACKIKVKL